MKGLLAGPAPEGDRDEHGNLMLPDGLAARLLTDDTSLTDKWLVARRAGLEGAEDRGAFEIEIRTLASIGIDHVGTLLAAKRAEEIEAEAAKFKLAAPEPRPRTPYDNAIKALGPFDADARDAYALLLEAQRRADRGGSPPPPDRREQIRALGRDVDALARRGDATVEEVRDLAARAISLGVDVPGDLKRLAQA